MQLTKLSLIVAGVCVGGLLGLSSGKAEPSGSELLLQKMSAQQLALTRELSAVRAELRAQEHATTVVHVPTLRASEQDGAAEEPAPYDDEPEPEAHREPALATPKASDPVVLEAQRAGQRILDEAAADGTWDQARALGFRAQLMRLAEPEHSALARSLMVRINRGEIVPEPELPGLF